MFMSQSVALAQVKIRVFVLSCIRLRPFFVADTLFFLVAAPNQPRKFCMNVCDRQSVQYSSLKMLIATEAQLMGIDMKLSDVDPVKMEVAE